MATNCNNLEIVTNLGNTLPISETIKQYSKEINSVIKKQVKFQHTTSLFHLYPTININENIN